MGEEMDRVWDEVNLASDETFPGWRNVHLLYWATALAGEVGEFCSLAKKREEGGPRAAGVTPEALVGELADVYISLQKTVETLGTGRTRFAATVQQKLGIVRRRPGAPPPAAAVPGSTRARRPLPRHHSAEPPRGPSRGASPRSDPP